MIYKIILNNLDLEQQLGSFENHLKKIQTAISASPLFSSKNKKIPLHMELFQQRESHQQVILVFKGLTLQNSVNAPADEIHGWLMQIFRNSSLPFDVSTIEITEESTYSPDPRAFTLANTMKLSFQTKSDPTGSHRPRIIPGFQIMCVRNEPHEAGVPIQAITQYFENFIRQVRSDFPMKHSRAENSIKFPNIYLHSCTHNAVIFILPCENLDNEDASDVASRIINTLFKKEDLPYITHAQFFKRENCFSSLYSETNNSLYLDLLETEELEGKMYCELSSQVMDDPVQMPGTPQVVERGAIELELKLRGINPYNRQPLTSAQLIPCPEMMSRIDGAVVRMVQDRIKRGTIRFKDGQFEQAIRDFLNVYVYCKGHSIPYPQEYSTVLNNLACCYREIFDYGKAIEYFHLLLLHDLRSNAPIKTKASHLQKLAGIYLKMRLPETAKKYFDSALKEFEKVGGQDAAASIKLKLDECKSFSTSIGESFSREPESLHSRCLEKEKEFYSELCELIRNTTLPEGPFILFGNDSKDFDTGLPVVPFSYGLEFNNNHESLRKVHERYDVRNISERILLAVIRNIQQPCVSASSRFEKDAQGVIFRVNLSVVLYFPSQNTRLGDIGKMLYVEFDRKRRDFMPQIGAHSSTANTQNGFFSARTSILFTQPKRMPVQSQAIEGCSYEFAECLQAENSAEKTGLMSTLKSFGSTLCVTTNLENSVDREIVKVRSRLSSHIREHGEISTNYDGREILRELAHLYYEFDNTNKAICFYRQVIDIDRAIISEDGNNLTSHLLLACSLIQLAKIYKKQGNHSRAFNYFQEGLTEYMKGKIDVVE